MTEDAARRRAERGERARAHAEAAQRRADQESAEAQVLVDRFVRTATERGIATEELTARPWTGRGRYKTGVVGWYLKKDRSVGVSPDGGYYLLVVAPERFGRLRGVHVEPTPPPLQVGRGARDGESVALDVLLGMRLDWPAPE